jgi:predicted ATP-grasp superfamily ATP-dependent carboligase
MDLACAAGFRSSSAYARSRGIGSPPPPARPAMHQSTLNRSPVRILLYEWCCSGGLVGCGPGADFGGIAREGRMILEALAADAVRAAEIDVTVLVDDGISLTLPAEVHVQPVARGGEVDALVAAANEHDWTVIVAPETDGILASRVAAARDAGARVLAPAAAFIAVASDKQATANALAAAGVPVPAGRSLAQGEPVPVGFHMPAVRKLRDGVGCDGMQIIRTRDVPPALAATRLEAFVAGTPVGVSCLCGPEEVIVLPPMRQRFTAGDAPRYVGSDLLDDPELARRAEALARRAVAAIDLAAGGEAAAGWVGVDMILGLRDDGRADRVLEVNPRVTTSFVALAARSDKSLVQTLARSGSGRAGKQ